MHEALPSLQSVRAERARRSLSEFVKQAWHVVEPATEFVPGWHIDAISEHLEAVTRGQIRRLLINMPPRHMKSLMVSVFWPCWEWASKPSTRWLFASYASDLAIRDSVKCRRLIDSPWYQSSFGHVFQLATDQNVKSRFDNTKLGYRLSTSVDSAVTGEGGDRIVVDDPHNVREAQSQAVRESTISWYREAMSTRGNDPKTVARVVVMQRVHERDLAGYLLSEGGWDHLCLPAEFEGKKSVTSIGWCDPRTELGQLLWPAQFGRPELEALKVSLGSYGTAGQLQQRPAPNEGGILKRRYWRFWVPKGMNPPPVTVRLDDGTLFECLQVELPENFDRQVQSWDMSFKDTAASAFVVGQVWATVGADRFLLDQCRDKMDLPRTLVAVTELSAKWPLATAKWIEDKANGPAVIQTLRKRITGMIPIDPKGDKVARAQAVAPIIEAGNVFLPHPRVAPWVDALINECAFFPAGEYKDQVDTLSQALIKLEGTVGQKARSYSG